MMTLPFVISGKVIHGQSLGNEYDIPTANIEPCEDTSDLAHGVYYSVACISGRDYASITNLGIRPTVSDDGRVNAETFIYDYDGDIYGREIKVTLLDFRRGERRFDSVDELFETIRKDLDEGLEYHRARSSMASV